LNLQPEFQRGHVWNIGQQEKYIAALLENRIKNADTIFLNCPNWNSGGYENFVCVDGLQRITAVTNFYNNKIKYNDIYFINDFEDKIAMLRYHLLKININTLKTNKEVMEWYIDMNSGGTIHTEEEIIRVRELILLEDI